MQKAKITVIAVEYSPVTGTKIVEKEIDVKAIALHDEGTNRNTQRAKAIAHTKQR